MVSLSQVRASKHKELHLDMETLPILGNLEIKIGLYLTSRYWKIMFFGSCEGNYAYRVMLSAF